MAVEERARRDLERRLEEVLGLEHAVVLMDHLPQGGPATKADLDALEQRLGQRIGGLDQRISRLDQRISGLEQRISGVEEGQGGLKQSMRELEQRLNERIDLKTQSMADQVKAALHEGLGALRMDIMAQTRLLFFSTIGALISLAAVMIAASQLR